MATRHGRAALSVTLVACMVAGAVARAEPELAPGLTTPFVNGKGEVATLVRPEFRDAPGLLADLKAFGIQGLALDLVGPLVAGPKRGQEIPSRLVLRGPPEVVARGREVLRYLDVPDPAVMVSLLAAEVRCEDVGEVGGSVSFLRSGVQGTPNTVFRGVYSEFEPATYLRSSLAATRPFAGSSVRFGNLGQDILEEGAFEYVLRYYAEQNQAEFLTWPTILCTEGRPGIVASSESTEERIITSTTADESAISIQARAVESGVTFTVVPVRVGRDAATLDVKADIRFLVPESSDGLAAGEVSRNRHQVSTRFSIRDQETLLIGGLTLRRKAKSTTGLPVVGAVPGFSRRSRGYVTSELILLVRIRILVGGRAGGIVLPPGEARRLETVRRLEAPETEAPACGR